MGAAKDMVHGVVAILYAGFIKHRASFYISSYLFWEDVFATLGKKKTRKQIAKWLSDPYSDGACYKMAGNGVVVAVADWIFEGIVANARWVGR
jgi:DNA (cytosine-5)-methyltransferase 1